MFMKNIETEVKIRLTKKEFDKIKKLARQLSRSHQEVVHEDVLLDHPKLKLKKNGFALRLRKQDDDYILTWKGKTKKSKKYKMREEIETKIGNGKNLVGILSKLGFRQNLKMHKKRHFFGINNCKICIDQVAQLGFFIEIEGNKNEIEKIAKNLGLANHKRITIGYAELLEERK